MSELIQRAGVPGAVRDFSLNELHNLADDVRERIIDVVTQTGGHMGSNLGVVELTLALHHVFDVRNDFFVWDVSNQTYTHKILTGRNDQLPTLRKFKGLSGFGLKSESPYDPWTFGHAGTSISVAVGSAMGDEKSGRDRHSIAVIGDGSMTEGHAYEALNHAGHTKPKNLIVILNDNAMSIAPSVGALNSYLSKVRTSPLYEETKSEIHGLLKKIPRVGESLDHLFDRVRESFKAQIGGLLFEELGISYYGPIDGHDLKALTTTLEALKKIDRPTLLHVITTKGKGHPEQPDHPLAVHAVSPKKPDTKKDSKIEAPKPTSSRPRFTAVFTDELQKIASEDDRVVAITAAMPDGTGLDKFAQVHPDKFFDVGIAEQHAVGFAAGLATVGYKPFITIYSTFLQRGYDQVMQEICLQELDCVIAMDRGGIAGNDGPTHHGVFDIAYARTLPGTVLMSPKDEPEFREMLRLCTENVAVNCIRYPRASAADPSSYGLDVEPVKLGKAEVLREGTDAVIIGYGIMAYHALFAADLLEERGLSVGVINGRFAKPIDVDTMLEACENYPLIFTLEDHQRMGGFGSAVAEAVTEAGGTLHDFHILGIPDAFVEHGDREQLMEMLKLDPQGVADTVWEAHQARLAEHTPVRTAKSVS